MSEKRELSILIPVYNSVCVDLVRELSRQTVGLGIDYEVIVADDASPMKETTQANSAINGLPGCRFIAREQNHGSAATRNFLAQESRYATLLFLDCDIRIPDGDFLRRYVETPCDGVINGGICIIRDESLSRNLRYKYERAAEADHSAGKRQMRSYQEFRSTNFTIAREAMLRCPFDERFKASGYEDVMFGKHLKQKNIPVVHISNPVMMADFEENAQYVAKVERSLKTLYRFRQELRGYSHLLTLVEGIHVKAIIGLIRVWHRCLGSIERKILSGSHPSLLLFKLYRLGYFLCIKE